MKKSMLVTILILSICLSSFAQFSMPYGESNAKDSKTKKENTVSAEKRAQEFTNYCQKKLSLDEATTKKVYNAALTHTQKLDEINGSISPNKEPELKENMAEFNAALKESLTEKQLAKIKKAIKKQNKIETKKED